MTYFPKPPNSESYTSIPLVLLPLISNEIISLKSFESNTKYCLENSTTGLTFEIPLSFYLIIWRICNYISNDLIEEKLGYGKENLNLIDDLKNEVQVDSLDLVEIALYLEKNNNLLVYEDIKFELVTDLVDYIFLVLSKRVKKSSFTWAKYYENSLTH